MSSYPDIIVTEPDSHHEAIAVEVKAGPVDMQAAEAGLKEYMVRQECPIGMLVTSGNTIFLRNRSTGYQPDSIQTIGECRTGEILDTMSENTPIPESYLVVLVQNWLENLPARSRRSWPPTAAEAIESYVLPEVAVGDVRSTGKRLRRTGS